jgi:hypothetical protein
MMDSIILILDLVRMEYNNDTGRGDILYKTNYY